MEQTKSQDIFFCPLLQDATATANVNVWTPWICKMNINAFTFPLEYKNIFTLKLHMCLQEFRANMTSIWHLVNHLTHRCLIVIQQDALYCLPCLLLVYWEKLFSITIMIIASVFIWPPGRREEERRRGEGGRAGRETWWWVVLRQLVF